MDNDFIGKRFGRLVVCAFDHQNKYKSTWWKCKCDCGNEKVVYRGSLTNGDSRSCGCLHKEMQHTYGFKHGESSSRLYKIWSTMIQRCKNPNRWNYERYGGRGISVCDEWKNDFRCFYGWANLNGYNNALTIDRVDPNGNYEPKNCRWATLKEQSSNRRNSRFVTYKGITKTLAEWARILNVKQQTLSYRVDNWDLDRALGPLPYSELIVGEKNEKAE